MNATEGLFLKVKQLKQGYISGEILCFPFSGLPVGGVGVL